MNCHLCGGVSSSITCRKCERDSKTIVRSGLVNKGGEQFCTLDELKAWGNVEQAEKETMQDIQESKARGDKEQVRQQEYKLGLIRAIIR